MVPRNALSYIIILYSPFWSLGPAPTLGAPSIIKTALDPHGRSRKALLPQRLVGELEGAEPMQTAMRCVSVLLDGMDVIPLPHSHGTLLFLSNLLLINWDDVFDIEGCF